MTRKKAQTHPNRHPKKATTAKKKRPQIVESMKAAASILGVDISTVRRAKELGCVAFAAGNRIDVTALREWMPANSDVMKAPVLSEKDKRNNAILDQELRKIKMQNDRVEGLLVNKQKGIQSIERWAVAVDAALEQKLEHEYPSIVSGLDQSQARVYGRRVRDQLRGEVRKLAQELGKLS